MQVEFHSLAITQTTGDAEEDQWFGRFFKLTDVEWSLFCGVFFRDALITRKEAEVRTALGRLFLHLYSWLNGGKCIDDCPGARLSIFARIWCFGCY